MADERTTPVNPKWGPLPDSLSDKTRKTQHGSFKRLGQFNVGKRRATLYAGL